MAKEQPDNQNVQSAWVTNARWWDQYVGAEGNDFHRTLVAPAQLRLLALQPGERVVEFACGNGHFAREMDRLGAHVLATDFAAPFIEVAKERSTEAGQNNIDFRIADATDEGALHALGEPHSFDAAVCTMAIHDIATLEPMMHAVKTLLKPSGRFVFSVTHPAFNHTGVIFGNETEDVAGEIVVRYTVKVQKYLHNEPARGVGIIGQPQPHWYFDRSISELFAPAFAAGLAVDGLEEPAFPEGQTRPEKPFSWSNYPHIPPVLVARLRPVTAA